MLGQCINSIRKYQQWSVKGTFMLSGGSELKARVVSLISSQTNLVCYNRQMETILVLVLWLQQCSAEVDKGLLTDKNDGNPTGFLVLCKLSGLF
jgi:hypothetical protein